MSIKHQDKPAKQAAQKPLEYAYYSLAMFVIFIVFISIYFNHTVTKIFTEITQYSEHLNVAAKDLTTLRSRIVDISTSGHNVLHSKITKSESDKITQQTKNTLHLIDDLQFKYSKSTISEIKQLFLVEVEKLKSKTEEITTVNYAALDALNKEDHSTAHHMMSELEILTRQSIRIFNAIDDKIHAFRSQYSQAKTNDANQLMALHYFLLLTMPILVAVFILYGVHFSKKLHQLEEERKRKTEDLEQVNQTLLDTAKELKHLKENAESATLAKSTFLANVSHEIRTPLTAIIGNSDTLLEQDVSASTTQECINSIMRNGNFLLQLINNVLDLSKIEANKLNVELIEVGLFELLDDMQQLMSHQAHAKGLDFIINSNFPLPEFIKIDPIRYKQILLNLCGNAIKFTETGKVEFKVSCDCDNKQLSISVIDTGIGMSSEEKQSIFQPFVQADSTTTRYYGGTGLGLSLTKLLLDKLGGKINVESAVGIGSNFTVTVPIGLEDIRYLDSPPNLVLTSEHADNENSCTFEGLILLVEDNRDNQLLISRLLSKVGLKVDLADNGKIAVNKALSGSYDLILMDIQMPIMNGLQATITLRENNYQGKIVAVTANTLNEEKRECLDAGFNDFLTKPVDKEQFYECLTKYLKFTVSKEDASKNNNTLTGAITDTPLTSTLLEEDPEIVELLEDYLKRLPTTIQTIKSAFEQSNWEHMRKQAHDLKSTSGLFGLKPLSELAAYVETELKSNSMAGLLTKLREMESLSTKIENDVGQQIKEYKKAI